VSRARAGILTAAVVLALVASLAGCGGGSEQSHAPPKVGGATISVFRRLPLYPGSQPATSRTTNPNGVVVQSFFVTGKSPDTLLRYYLQRLQDRGWKLANADRRGATNSARVVFRKQDRELAFTSSLAPTAGTNVTAQSVTSQYSLLLYPRGVSAAP
jgi:hypothetical protein